VAIQNSIVPAKAGCGGEASCSPVIYGREPKALQATPKIQSGETKFLPSETKKGKHGLSFHKEETKKGKGET